MCLHKKARPEDFLMKHVAEQVIQVIPIPLQQSFEIHGYINAPSSQDLLFPPPQKKILPLFCGKAVRGSGNKSKFSQAVEEYLARYEVDETAAASLRS